MSPNCIDVDRIADVESAPEGHPLRQHVASCPRCQSLWLSYQSFMKADVTGATNIEAAREALAATIRQKAAPATGAAVPRTAPLTVRPWWAAWTRPALVGVMAGLIAVAVSVWRGGGSDESVLRGAGDTTWSLQAPQLSAGSIVFEWKAVKDADGYEVQVFNDALSEVYHTGELTTTSATVDRTALSGVAAGATLTWRVRALHAGDVISTSPPSSLTLH
jgi:hypothetical protein